MSVRPKLSTTNIVAYALLAGVVGAAMDWLVSNADSPPQTVRIFAYGVVGTASTFLVIAMIERFRHDPRP